jgi:ABC-2 type transport system ATP-binding protein
MQQLLRSLAAEGVTVLLSSHNMVELDGLCDSVTVMRDGRSVWEGSMERLRSEAPAPAHRMWTSDDDRAQDVAGSLPAVAAVRDPAGWLMVSAEAASLDAYVVALGQAGVAVRRLEPLMTALESMFLELTGTPGERSAERSELGALR